MTKTHDTLIRFKNIPPGAESDYPAALQSADILVVAESQKRDAARFADRKTWITVHFPGGSSGRVAMHFRRCRYRVEWQKTVLLNDANGLTFPGARRLGLAVRVQDMWTGRYFNIEGDHFVPHADDPKHPGAIIRTPRGARAVIPAIKSIVARFPRRRSGQDVVVGDFNIDLDADIRHRSANDMLERVNKVGLYSDVQLLGPVPDTHGRNEYDWILLRLSRKVCWPVSHGTGRKRKSDHKDRWVRLRSTVRRGWKVPAAYAA